ncbi:MAG: putative selenate reductase subunit YgfK, partial [Ignavibacteria bacterium]|nr:putative selenate reductase subunit YgfK [Ignavibacteria bacterium]
WIFNEYKKYNSIFNIPSHGFVNYNSGFRFKILNEQIDSLLGPAAGPHTQMTQNIICSYICGGRFFELKTVQALDELEIEKPCIYAADEGYNTEWSQELKLSSSFDEYLKAWFLLHFLKELFPFSNNDKNGFIFNMSVGYDLKGIKSNAIDKFIDDLLDCSNNVLFEKYKTELLTLLDNDNFISLIPNTSDQKVSIENLKTKIENISPRISNSVTLSTMHGCPPDEIESIVQYLIKEKGLHTYAKLNPTLLGYETVKKILSDQGYDLIPLNEKGFVNDLQLNECIPLLKRLIDFSKANNKFFGIKLTNTLGVLNKSKILPGEEMYLSGRALFPLTINLANKIAKEFAGKISISYSGGASIFNIKELLQTGITPITLVTDLLKPGGYLRLSQISNFIKNDLDNYNNGSEINVNKLDRLAKVSLKEDFYKKEFKETETVSINKSLPKFDCYTSPCSIACPIHQDVAEYIHYIKVGNYLKAIEVITDKNPLPNITGYICDHLCETQCTRWDYDKPVQIRELKKIAAEKGLDAFIKKVNKKKLRTNAKVAVIGAGPSGLTAAYFLSKAGVKVTVFEKTDKAGGNVSHVIPSFRLPYSVIEKDVEFIKIFGVKFQYNTNPDFIISDLHKTGYEFVYIAIGAGVSKILHLNDNNENVLDSIKFLKEFNKNKISGIGKNVAVIGGGNSAMDAARAAKRLSGVENVYIIYRRTKKYMPADMEEFDSALKDGVKFKELLQPFSFDKGVLKCQRMELSDTDSDGRRKVTPIANDHFIFNVDTVIAAVGEKVDENVLQKNELLKNGKIIINESTLETDKTNTYIGGDAFRGPSTVVEAIADGARAANSILNKLGLVYNYSCQTISTKAIDDALSKVEGKVFTKKTVDEQIMAEKCLSCNYKCNKCVEVCPNRANIIVTAPTAEEYKDSHQIIHIDDLCNECGNCTTFCPYDGAPYKDKLTVFGNQSEFLNSVNDGFCLSINSNAGSTLNLRYKNKVLKLKLDKNGKIIERDSAYEKITNIIDQLTTNYKYLLDITYKE